MGRAWSGSIAHTASEHAGETALHASSRPRGLCPESHTSASIILFHDGGREKPGTVQAVEIVLEKLKARGYRFVTVSELLALGGVAPAPGTATANSAPAAN